MMLKRKVYIQDNSWRLRLANVTAGRRGPFQTLQALNNWRLQRVN